MSTGVELVVKSKFPMRLMLRQATGEMPLRILMASRSAAATFRLSLIWQKRCETKHNRYKRTVGSASRDSERGWPTPPSAADPANFTFSRRWAKIANNLMGSTHIRYGGYGGIVYHHIAGTYIALFTSFISCGVWEGVHILDALTRNKSNIQPDTLHADTQGQSEPIFGLCRVVGVKLMPRMRGLSDAVFYRPGKAIRYRHIDTLFGDEIDWELIATHAQDMIQVALSIQAGRVMPSMLLRKLGSYSRKSLLYRAFRELGRVERTLFLLRYISNTEVRRVIRAETTKIEAYNDFFDCVCFGGPVVKSGDPVEQEKQLKYASLVANTVMLSNVADLTAVIADMARDGHPVNPELVAATSPYMREQIRRFGRFTLDMQDLPDPLNPQPLPFETAL